MKSTIKTVLSGLIAGVIIGLLNNKKCKIFA